MLENFKGYLQSDRYVVYDIINKQDGIELFHYMAHARRMFHEALENDKERAGYALNQIQHLYAIERICTQDALNFAQITQVLSKLFYAVA
jgi:hypothetical protein